MEGDAELLAATEVKPVPKRDEWMTTLPPERKVRETTFEFENAFFFFLTIFIGFRNSVSSGLLRLQTGVPVQQSTSTFSRNAREGRGDTTAWTDTPMDKAERAKMK